MVLVKKVYFKNIFNISLKFNFNSPAIHIYIQQRNYCPRTRNFAFHLRFPSAIWSACSCRRKPKITTGADRTPSSVTLTTGNLLILNILKLQLIFLLLTGSDLRVIWHILWNRNVFTDAVEANLAMFNVCCAMDVKKKCQMVIERTDNDGLSNWPFFVTNIHSELIFFKIIF